MSHRLPAWLYFMDTVFVVADCNILYLYGIKELGAIFVSHLH
jgi:hypothetical protein